MYKPQDSSVEAGIKAAVKVSVIVPAFNLENYIEECLRSLLDQETDFPYEIIVCDDASTDNTLKVINRLGDEYGHLVVLQNECNLGLAATMKTLLTHCRGQYICYLDGDDLVLPGKLQKQAEYLDNNQQCSMVYCETDVFDSETGKTLHLYSENYYNAEYIPASATVEHLVRYGCFMHVGAVMLRAHEKLDDCVNPNCRIALDHPWLVNNLLMTSGTIEKIDAVLSRYRIHAESFGGMNRASAERRIQVLKDQLLVCADALKAGVDEKIVTAGIRHYQYATALFFLRSGDFDLFQQHIRESTDGSWFHNERHKRIFNDQIDPEALQRQEYSVA